MVLKVVVSFLYSHIKMLFDAFTSGNIYIYLLELWKVILLDESQQPSTHHHKNLSGIGKL